MRVLIHALAAREHGGTERHLRAFLPALAQVCPDDDYILYTDPVFDPGGAYPNVRVERVSARSFWQRLWWDNVVLPRLAVSEKVDVLWALLSFGAIRPPVPQVMFQRNAMYYCDYYVSLTRGAGRHILHLRRWLLWLVMRASARIVVPTAAMRRLVRLAHSDIPLDRFTVIPHAFDERVLIDGDCDHPVLKVLRKCTTDTIKLLYVGHILPYKGLFDLLDAFSRVVSTVNRDVKLFLTIAEEDWPEGYHQFLQAVHEKDMSEHVQVIGKVPHEVMPGLYRGADILVYPSLCESFGFPLLEGMSFGLPVVAADTAVNRELAGDAALYYTPLDIQGQAKQILRLVQNPGLRDQIGSEARIHVERSRLSWREYAHQCQRVNYELLGRHGGLSASG